MNQEYLKSLFDYKDGQLIWKVSTGKRAKVGNIAGSLGNSGYFQISINKKLYLSHRLIYIWHYGNIESHIHIDHINRIRNDNNIENLRLVTCQENNFNRGMVKGYDFHKKTNKFRAQIEINNKKINLGMFNTKEEAREAYLKAKQEIHIIKDRK